MNTCWPLYMQKQSCRCCAALPGRWSSPDCSCPVGGRGPTAPPERSLKDKGPQSKPSQPTDVSDCLGLCRVWNDPLTGCEEEHKLTICYWGIVSWRRLRFPPVAARWVTVRQRERWYETTSKKWEETAIKRKLLTKPNQGVVVTVMDSAASAISKTVNLRRTEWRSCRRLLHLEQEN